jgi:Ca-activated chloride channel family protein
MSRRLPAVTTFLALAALLLTPIAPHGQSQTPAPPTRVVTVLGSVVDAALAPLSGVVVTLLRDGRAQATTRTADDGTFRFADVAAGNYTVRTERTGFPTTSRELRVTGSTPVVRLPIVMARPGESAPVAQAGQAANAPARSSGVAPPPASLPPPATATTASGGGGGRGGGRGDMSRMGQMAVGAPQAMAERSSYVHPDDPWSGYRYPHSGERYARVEPNRFQSAFEHPLSTFGADVDTASYTNVRRFLSNGQLPPREAVRVEEFVNYFRFAYDGPRDGRPIALTTEIGDCPWAPAHKLVLIGARAKSVAPREIEGRNIVLLLDVSGSMAPADRLPLIKAALRMFVDTLNADDRLAIVTYAGSSGVALPSTSLRRRDVVQQAVANLSAGGSTNGASGLITAYRVARDAYIPGGVNRVILATDGDFNVGITDQRDLLRLIEREKHSGVFLSVLGVGTGNLKDSTMELLADRGNGHYSYLDSLQEARRVLVREADATIDTVAKDVKFQVEFNPAIVGAWKLIGYENRLLASQDFNDDRKDGGEMGAGHSVTVLYEIVPAGVEFDRTGGSDGPSVDPLRYQTPPAPAAVARPVVVDPARAGEWLTVKARYKMPEGEQSQLITHPVRTAGRVQHLPLAAVAAELGLLLRSGTGNAERWDGLVSRARRLQAPAPLAGELAGFVELAEIARGLARR